MAKHIKAHINLASQGEHEFLTTVSFEHPQSDCLRIQEIRLRPLGGEKPFQLQLKLLTWYTEHAAAGREITRDDNNQNSEADLYIELSELREQIETFALKSPFMLEIEISERDRDDESLARKDRGMIEIEVNLFHGPKAGCNLEIGEGARAGQNLTFPVECAIAGRFDLAQFVLKSDQGPLDPRTDKRVALCNIKLSGPFENLRHAIIERLRLYQGHALAPSQYIHDEHQYAELFETFPTDQKMQFPDGLALFGPLMPLAPKDKDAPWTISLKAPVNDPFWVDLNRSQRANDNVPLSGEIELILPEPGGNIYETIPLTIAMDKADWLIISDGAAQSAPAIIPVNRGATDKDQENNSLTIKPNLLAPPSSDFLSIQYYGNGLEKGLVNVSLIPLKKDTKYVTIKPEVIEIADHERHMVLLNTLSRNKKQKHQKAGFQIKCSWPQRQHTEQYQLTIERAPYITSHAAAIDIGSKTISMALLENEKARLLPLKSLLSAEDVSVEGQSIEGQSIEGKPTKQNASAYCLPAVAALTTAKADAGVPDNEVESYELSEQNWRADKYPLSISFQNLPWQENALAHRLKDQRRHYDLGLPPVNEASPLLNLKRLFTKTITPKPSHVAPLYVALNGNASSEDGPELALTTTINPNWLMADCLDELYNFYGTYLTRQFEKKHANGQTSVEKDLIAPSKKSPMLVLTHPGYLSDQGKRRYITSGATALTNYEQGSFGNMAEAAELLGLKSKDSLTNNVRLIPETEAAAYHCLKRKAEKEQPARARKIEQIHIEIGEAHMGIAALGGWLGETGALLEEVFGAINLNHGGRTLELALMKEISILLETALKANAPIIPNTSLPLTSEEITEAQTSQTDEARLQKILIESLRTAIDEYCQTPEDTEQNLNICLAKSSGDEDKSWPVSLSSMVEFEGQTIKLWQGPKGAQLMLREDVTPESWRLDLEINPELMAEKVGPLSGWLAFITEFLPRTISHCFKEKYPGAERLISVTGGTSMFPPLRKAIKASAKKLGCHLLPLCSSYDQAATAAVTGGLELIAHQGEAPFSIIRPNLLLAPITEATSEVTSIAAIAQLGNLSIITDERAQGSIPATCTTLQLIETIPGLGGLMQSDPEALHCETYQSDLDRPTKQEKAQAKAEWQAWLSQCYQIMLNMPVSDEGTTPQSWSYQALKQDEAELTIAGKAYWISSGLVAAS